VLGFTVALGGTSAGAGAASGGLAGATLGGVSVVTVSGGSWAAREVLGDGVCDALGGPLVRGADVTEVGAGAPTVAFVDALSPLLMITAVAIAPIATTAPSTATAGRHVPTGHRSSLYSSYSSPAYASSAYSSSS
jgi:hypothetical protein